jgi:phosphomannomutase/phosphoglucomutase
MQRLFGTFGVRGISNVDLIPKLAFELGLALATHLRGRGEVAVGRDNRTSSEMLENAITAGLTSGGCNVVLIGLAPTPVLSFAIKRFRCAAGVMITASHNPPQYNGVKFWGNDGAGMSREQEVKIEKIIYKKAWKRASWCRIGRVSRSDAITPYMEAVLGKVPRVGRKLKVVVDCANAAGSVVTPRLLTELGCQVISMNCQLDGTFPGRKLEPVPENLGELAKTVVACKADLGIAHDGDADRTLVVDERGGILSGDRVFALVALHHLRERKHPRIITTVATSAVLDDVASKLGGKVARTRVGEPEIIGEFRKRGGDIGGEENGGVIFPDWLFCREGIMTAVKFIELLDRTGMKVSELDASLPRYSQAKQRIECSDELKPKVLRALAKRFAGQKLDRTDGLRVVFDDGWLLLRPSGTEPIFRCFAEARSEERAKELASRGMKELRACIKKLS